MYEDLESWVCDDSKDTSLPRLIKYLIERGVSGRQKLKAKLDY